VIGSINTAVCWGENGSGQLGNGVTATYSATPVAVTGGLSWAELALGRVHTCGITLGGALYCWGSNTNGQLGLGAAGGTYSSPQRVGAANNWIHVAAGQYHACAVNSLHEVWCWGYNGLGQVGDGTNAQRNGPTQVSTL
jgi:alpha-tubulin suppressor-like RCC1 family protein